LPGAPEKSRGYVLGCSLFFLQRGQGGKSSITAWVERLIPHGDECCHFVVERRKDQETKNPWHIYSDQLEERALRKIGRKENSS